MRSFWLLGCRVCLRSAAISLFGCSSHPPTVLALAPGTPPPSTSSGASSSGSGAAGLPAASAAPSTPGKMCGGIAGLRCDAGQYCAFPLSAHCGAGDMAGSCRSIPDMCTMEFAPVCGCDGKTYATACVAARVSVSVAANGGCPGDSGSTLADGALCGTRGIPGECSKGSYCAYESQCGGTDTGGVCSKRPEICSDLFAAVCGCDGKTYPNACYAQRQGVSVAAPGACKP